MPLQTAWVRLSKDWMLKGGTLTTLSVHLPPLSAQQRRDCRRSKKKIAEMVQQVGNGVRTANDEFRSALLAAVGQMSKQLGENITATNNELRTVLLSAAKQTSDSVEAAHHSVQLAGAGVKAASDRMKAIGEEMKASNDELKNVLLAAIQILIGNLILILIRWCKECESRRSPSTPLFNTSLHFSRKPRQAIGSTICEICG